MIGFTLESEISGGIMNRREFLKMSAMAVAAPAFGKVQKTADRKAATSLFKITPHVQLLNEDAVAIVWVTHSKSTGYVTWSQDGWKTTERAWDEEDGLLSANSTLHRAFISGIDPSKPLEYKAHSRAFDKFGPYSVSYSGVEEVCSGTEVRNSSEILRTVALLLKRIIGSGRTLNVNYLRLEFKRLLCFGSEFKCTLDYKRTTNVLLSNNFIVFKLCIFKNNLKIFKIATIVKLDEAEHVGSTNSSCPTCNSNFLSRKFFGRCKDFFDSNAFHF